MAAEQHDGPPAQKKVTIRLEEPLWMRFRVILLKRGESAQGVVSDFIRRYVEHHETKEGA